MAKKSNVLSLSLTSIIILLLLTSCEDYSLFNFWHKKNPQDCILNSELSYSQILSKEDLENVLSLKPENIIEESNGYPSDHMIGYCYYKWPSNRPDKKSELSEHILLPDNNYVRIENYKRYDTKLNDEDIKNLFYDEFTTLTKSKESLNHKKNLSSKLKNKDFEYVWKVSPTRGGKLIFLKANEKLEINIKVSNDSGENLKSAKKLAQIIINKCK